MAYLEIISSSGQELIANMESSRRTNTTEILLAGFYTPCFISNIDEDVISSLRKQVNKCNELKTEHACA